MNEAEKIKDWCLRLDRIEEHVKSHLADVRFMLSVRFDDPFKYCAVDPPHNEQDEWEAFPYGTPIERKWTMQTCRNHIEDVFDPILKKPIPEYLQVRIRWFSYLFPGWLNWPYLRYHEPEPGDRFLFENMVPRPNDVGDIWIKEWYYFDGLSTDDPRLQALDAIRHKLTRFQESFPGEQLERVRKGYSVWHRFPQRLKHIPQGVIHRVGPIHGYATWMRFLLFLAVTKAHPLLNVDNCQYESDWMSQPPPRTTKNPFGFGLADMSHFRHGEIRFTPNTLTDAVHYACELLREVAERGPMTPAERDAGNSGEDNGHYGATMESKGESAPRAADQIESPSLEQVLDVVHGQRVAIVKCLWDRKHPTDYGTLIALRDCWRKDDVTDETIQKALKRVKATLNDNPDLKLDLEISHAERRAKLVRLSDK